MRSDRKKQIMTLSILLISIFVISIGFAAFSRTFEFEPTLTVNPDSRMFGVKFSKTSNEVTIGTVTPNPIPSQETLGLSKEIVAEDITIDGSTTLEGLFATFISPGDSVEYSFYAVNAGEYDAYLNSINFIGNKTCTAGIGTTNDLVQAACNGISMEVTIDDITYKSPTTLTGKKLNKKAHQTITVKLSYAESAARADGPFTVEFQDLSLYYSTVNGMNEDSSGSEILYTGVIYRNSTENLSIGDNIAGGDRWCAVDVKSPTTSSCILNTFFLKSFNSKEECEAELDTFANSFPVYLEEVTCEQDTTPISYEISPLNINKTYYLKHEVVNNIVTASYACITYTENGTRKDVCLRGGDPTYYVSNQSILRSVESYFNTLDFRLGNNGKGYCSFNVSNSYCDSDSLNLLANSGGHVNAIGGSSGCYVISVGYSYCS